MWSLEKAIAKTEKRFPVGSRVKYDLLHIDGTTKGEGQVTRILSQAEGYYLVHLEVKTDKQGVKMFLAADQDDKRFKPKLIKRIK